MHSSSPAVWLSLSLSIVSFTLIIPMLYIVQYSSIKYDKTTIKKYIKDNINHHKKRKPSQRQSDSRTEKIRKNVIRDRLKVES